MSAQKTHQLFFLKTGEATLQHIASGEIMHSNVGPREEATLLYIEQSRLREKLLQQKANLEANEPLVLYDLGLGAGTNALAALQCQKKIEIEAKISPRPLHLISFENDLLGLQLAIENHGKFPFFEGFEEAAKSLLQDKEWTSPSGLTRWTLREGDFRENTQGCPPPEVMFFDFYSPKVSPDLWSIEIFKLLRSLSEPRQQKGLSTELFTYSVATRIRVALLLAGFYVGYGRSTGAKQETTVASTKFEDLEKPLDLRWLVRFQRSHDRSPYNLQIDEENIERLIFSHPQFEGKTSIQEMVSL